VEDFTVDFSMLELTPEQAAFRDEVRRFFASDYPRPVIDKLAAGQRLEKADHIAAQRAINQRGWLGVGWPREFGGTGWTPVERYIFDQELELAGAASIIPMGVIYIGPIICAFGSPEQKARWLPDILESRVFWAQGYSEPEAGSDLASLRFSAVREGEEYVLNGTKIWTSGALMADWIFLLARTSKQERKQQGISLICAPLDLPGVTVSPIRLLDGSYELGRVDFVDVRVPVSHRIGEEGQAWHYANVLLKAERLSYAHIGAKKRDLAKARTLAATVPAGRGAMMSGDPDFNRAAARIEARVGAIEAAVVLALHDEPTMALTAALKIACTECAQEITELFLQLAGRNRLGLLDRAASNWADAAPGIPSFASVAVQSYFFERAQTIYGGSNEIQKNIIWRWLRSIDGPAARPENLSLPSELRVLRDAVRAAMGDRTGQSVIDQLEVPQTSLSDDEAALIMVEAGRVVLDEPMAETLLAKWLLSQIPNAQAARLHQQMLAGARVAMVWAEPHTRYDFDDITTEAIPCGKGWRLGGMKSAVRFGPQFGTLLVLATVQDSLGLFSVPRTAAGITTYVYPAIDSAQAADFELAHVSVADADCLIKGDHLLELLEEYRDRAVVLQAAEATGVLASIVEQTVAFTSGRHQFGQPIANFQALQHRMVDMYRQSELVMGAGVGALTALRRAAPVRRRAASMAQAVLSESCRSISQEAVQLHGGMGMADELPLARYVRRATMMSGEWGDADWHFRRLVSV
jgi:alkylation response protein AidB-like acyl-CoA dehydrogenase